MNANGKWKIRKDLPKEERFLSMTTTLSIGTEPTITELAGKAVVLSARTDSTY